MRADPGETEFKHATLPRLYISLSREAAKGEETKINKNHLAGRAADAGLK
jgi:hypothetical protein